MLEKLKRIDGVGAVTLTGSLVSLLYGITAGGVLHPWVSANILVALLVGVVGVIVFLIYEHYGTQQPMIPLRIFRDRTAASGYLTTWAHALVLWAINYYLILYFLISQEKSLMGAAISTLPGSATIPFIAAAAGVVMQINKHFMPHNIVGWVLITTAMGLLSSLRADSGRGAQYSFQILYGVGGGIIYPGRLYAAQAPQPDADVAIATTMVSFLTSLGEAFGVSIGGTVFQNRWDALVSNAIRDGTISADYRISGNSAERAAVLLKTFPESIQHSYRSIMARSAGVIWITMASISGLALLGSLFSRNLSLDKEGTSEQKFETESLEVVNSKTEA